MQRGGAKSNTRKAKTMGARSRHPRPNRPANGGRSLSKPQKKSPIAKNLSCRQDLARCVHLSTFCRALRFPTPTVPRHRVFKVGPPTFCWPCGRLPLTRMSMAGRSCRVRGPTFFVAASQPSPPHLTVGLILRYFCGIPAVPPPASGSRIVASVASIGRAPHS